MAYRPDFTVAPVPIATPMALNVVTYGAIGDGVADDTGAFVAAIADAAGKSLYIPKGKYKITSTLVISTRMTHLIGEFGGRNANGGTELQYFGTGPCIQFGADAGVAWDANYYLGKQDQLIENLWISHGAPNTTLANGVSTYKAAAYGIWDWYGGGIILRNVGIEQFEASFVGIQSDIDSFENVQSHYSKWGIYLSPRSDQVTISRLYSFFCDRAITIDRASSTRIVDPQIVGCGTASIAAIEVRQGSSAVRIVRPWFEHLQGYAGTDQLAFMSVGEVAGYSSGGSISSSGNTPTTTSVSGCTIEDAFVYTTLTGQVNHTKYMVAVGKCQNLMVRSPNAPAGSSLTNLDALVGVQSSQAPANSDTNILITDINSSIPFSHIFVNGGAGDPVVHVIGQGASGLQHWGYSSAGLTLNRQDADPLKSIQFTTSNNVGGLFAQLPVNPPNWQSSHNYALNDTVTANGKWYLCVVAGTSDGVAPSHISGTAVDGTVTWQFESAAGQQTRLQLFRALRQGSSVPASGNWINGDTQWNTSCSAGGIAFWQCYNNGAPGSWQFLKIPLVGTGSWTPNIADGAAGSTTVTVSSAAVGDVATVGFTQAVPANVLMTAAVTSSNTVTVSAWNKSGSLWNPASGTLTVYVTKQ